MSTQATNTALGTFEGLDKFEVSIFELCNKGKSGWIMDGTGYDTGRPSKSIHYPKELMIEPTSRLFLGKGNGYLKTQYVIGAPTIYEQDHYLDAEGNLVLKRVTTEQAKESGYQHTPGLRTLGYDLKEEYSRTLELQIGFIFGILDVRKYADDPLLLKFIMEHEQNNAAPRASENRDPKRLKLFQFKPLIPEQKASKLSIVADFDATLDALLLVKQMRDKQANGSYVYDEDKMDAVLAILEEGMSLKPGDVNQKFAIIAKIADRDSQEFLEIVNGAMSDVRNDINMAHKLGVIKFGAKECKFTEGGKDILTFKKGTDKDGQIEEVVNYFLANQVGKMDYAEVQRLTEIKKQEALTKK